MATNTAPRIRLRRSQRRDLADVTDLTGGLLPTALAALLANEKSFVAFGRLTDRHRELTERILELRAKVATARETDRVATIRAASSGKAEPPLKTPPLEGQVAAMTQQLEHLSDGLADHARELLTIAYPRSTAALEKADEEIDAATDQARKHLAAAHAELMRVADLRDETTWIDHFLETGEAAPYHRRGRATAPGNAVANAIQVLNTEQAEIARREHEAREEQRRIDERQRHLSGGQWQPFARPSQLQREPQGTEPAG